MLAAIAFFTTSTVAISVSAPLQIRSGSRTTTPFGNSGHGIDSIAFPVPPARNPSSWIDDNGRPIPPSTGQIQYAPAPIPNHCFSRKGCSEVAAVALNVVEKILDGDSAAPTSSNTTTSGVRPSLPNGDTAITIARNGIAEPYMGLLSADEQKTFAESPVCFFANVERMYASAAASNTNNKTTTPAPVPTTTSTRASTTPTSTQPTCTFYDCSKSSIQSTLSSSQAMAVQKAFFQDILPEKLSSIHAATAAATTSTTTNSMETATTTCSAFDDGRTYLTSFVQKAAVTWYNTSETRPVPGAGAVHVVASRHVKSIAAGVFVLRFLAFV